MTSQEFREKDYAIVQASHYSIVQAFIMILYKLSLCYCTSFHYAIVQAFINCSELTQFH